MIEEGAFRELLAVAIVVPSVEACVGSIKSTESSMFFLLPSLSLLESSEVIRIWLPLPGVTSGHN